MNGFKEFLMRGNLIELAVAFILGTAFAAVVTAFTGVITDVIGLIFSVPDFSNAAVGGVNVGTFINAVLAFVIVAAVLYFGLVTPYQRFQESQRKRKAAGELPAVEETEFSTSEQLLVEIRDLLRGR